MNKKIAGIVLLIIAIILIVWGFQNKSGVGEKQTIKIGLVGPLTGGASAERAAWAVACPLSARALDFAIPFVVAGGPPAFAVGCVFCALATPASATRHRPTVIAWLAILSTLDIVHVSC